MKVSERSEMIFITIGVAREGGIHEDDGRRPSVPACGDFGSIAIGYAGAKDKGPVSRAPRQVSKFIDPECSTERQCFGGKQTSACARF